MIAQDLNYEMEQIRLEVRRVCDLHDVDPAEAWRVEASLTFAAYQRAIQPWVDAKVRIIALAMPSYVLFPDGHIERRGDGLTDEARASLKLLDEHIARIAERYGRTVG